MAMKKNMKFEEAMALLEGAVSKLENGSIGLDEAIATYEEAVGLIRVCNEKLSCAEQKVKLLVENPDGSVTDRVFDDYEA